MQRFIGFSSLLLLTVALVLGCGGKSSNNLNLTGKVAVKGEPAKHVTITLYSKDGQTFTALTGDDGTFTIYGAAPGEMVVTITSSAGGYAIAGGQQQPKAPEAQGPGAKYGKPGKGVNTQAPDPKAEEKMKAHMKDAKGGPPAPQETTKVNAKYGDKTKSGLTWNVTPEKTTQDFNLDE